MALPLHILYIYKETDVFVPRRVYCALQYVPNGMAWCAVWCLTYGESRSTLCQYSSTWSLCAEISVYFSGNDGYFIAWCLCRVHGAESCVHGENVCPPSMMFVPCARCRVLNARGKCLPPYSMMFVHAVYTVLYSVRWGKNYLSIREVAVVLSLPGMHEIKYS